MTTAIITIHFNESLGINDRIRKLDIDPDELKGAEIISATLTLDDGHEVPYMGYDGPGWKLLLVHATKLIIKYKPS